MAQEQIPESQWAMAMTGKGKLQLKKVPVPVPQAGEVLIKVMCAPINPSDLYCMKGQYDDFDLFKIPYPNVPGWEGSGFVVRSGGGFMGWRALGKRVAFVRKVEAPNVMNAGGAYQQYVITAAETCIPLDDSLSMELGSMSFVNPLTALGLYERTDELKARAFAQTGAASQLGRMLIKLAKNANKPLINIVRREEQVKLLKEEYGCKYVLNSSSEGFFEEYQALAKELRASVLIECIGGDITGQLMERMPSRSTMLFYGCLSEKPVAQIDPLLFIGRAYTLEGFILGKYLQGKGIWIVRTIGQATRLIMDKTLQSNVQKKFTLSQFKDTIPEYYKGMTAGKFILCPNDPDDVLDSADRVTEVNDKMETIFQEFDIQAHGTE